MWLYDSNLDLGSTSQIHGEDTEAKRDRSNRSFKKQQLHDLDKWWGGEKIYEVISSVLTLEAMAPMSPPKSLNKKGIARDVFGSMWILLHHWPAQV